jgi:hypothetical protein
MAWLLLLPLTPIYMISRRAGKFWLAVVMALQPSGFSRQTEVARIGVPVDSAVSSQEVAEMNWWFMSGDTDFL